MQVFLQVFLGAGWHKLLQEEVLHATQPTGKPRFLSEVSFVMGVGFLDDVVSLVSKLLGCGYVV